MFGCLACKAKDEEIKHLRAVVDSILIGKGLAPVAQPASGPEPAEGVDVPEKHLGSEDIVEYGGDRS